MNRSGKVLFYGKIIGKISETDDGFEFRYTPEYSQNPDNKAISFLFPVQEMPFKQKQLFAFFDGLIPEGWLLDIAINNWKLNQRDRMGLLLATCQDCIGAVSIEKIEENERK